MCPRLRSVPHEEPVASAWFEYLHERARVVVGNEVAWRLIGEIAGVLLLRGFLAGDDVCRIATAFLDRLDALPPSNIVELPVLGSWPAL